MSQDRRRARVASAHGAARRCYLLMVYERQARTVLGSEQASRARHGLGRTLTELLELAPGARLSRESADHRRLAETQESSRSSKSARRPTRWSIARSGSRWSAASRSSRSCSRCCSCDRGQRGRQLRWHARERYRGRYRSSSSALPRHARAVRPRRRSARRRSAAESIAEPLAIV